MLMPLVLDDYAEPADNSQAEAYAEQCGLLRDLDYKPSYTVMVSTLFNEKGVNCTTPGICRFGEYTGGKIPAKRQFFWPPAK